VRGMLTLDELTDKKGASPSSHLLILTGELRRRNIKTYTINESGIEHIRLQLVDKLKDGSAKEWFEDEHLKDSAETKKMLLAWASDLQDEMNVAQEGSGEVELKYYVSKSGNSESISVGDGDFDVLHLQWQVTYDTEHTPAFGLDMFDYEDDAFSHGYSLYREGRKNVVVTLFEDDSPTETFVSLGG